MTIFYAKQAEKRRYVAVMLLFQLASKCVSKMRTNFTLLVSEEKLFAGEDLRDKI